MGKEKFNKSRYQAFGLATTLLICFLYFLQFEPLQTIDLKLYDLFFMLRGEEKHSQQVVIVAIDEPSIEKLGDGLGIET